MKRRTAHIFLIVIISACSYRNENKSSAVTHTTSATRQDADSIEELNHPIKPDSIETSADYHDLVLKSEKLIHHPNDDIVLSIIDSLNSQTNQLYHFLVFTKSLNGSDGYYSEGAGYAAYNYVERQTESFASFFASSDRLSDEDLSNWAGAILGEIQIAFENKEKAEIERYTTSIQLKVKGSKEVNRSVVNALIDEMTFQRQKRLKTAPN